MIKLKSLLSEGKISSDVEQAAKKLGIKFKKKVKTKFTNDFTGVNEPGEKVKFNSWMDDNPKDMKNQTNQLVKILQKKYKLVKHNKYARGEGFVFSKKNKDPKSIFSISYAKSMAGPYISYDGVFGE